MFLREDMFEVVFKLLAANSTDYVICSRFWLLNAFGVFFILVFLAFHVGYVVAIFLVKKLCVLLGKFSLLLKLEDRCTIWSFKIECRQIVFSNVYLRP